MCGIFGLIQQEDITQQQNELYTGFFYKTKHRGPDNSQIIMPEKNIFLGFHRLAINDLSDNGNQPLTHINYPNIYLMCNGEIYNHKELVNRYKFDMKSNSDCEIILHMYANYGIDKTIKSLDGYYAFAIYDGNKKQLILGRDIIGVRPLFITEKENLIAFSSEVKSLGFMNYNNTKQLEPGVYNIYDFSTNIIKKTSNKYYHFTNDTPIEPKAQSIYRLLDNAVEKRLMSDRPIGAFLSGGVDSSIVVALLAQHYHNFMCFTVALKDNNDNIIENDDIIHAKILVEYLNKKYNSNIIHKIIAFNTNEITNAIEPLIECLETWDTTTIRASVCQYLLSKWIAKNTDIRVVYSGEGSDEIFAGYKMFRASPSATDLHNESRRLVEQLNYFDCLRTDRSVSNAGLEVRVPFLDNEFFDYVMKINPNYKLSNERLEKYILREAFNDIMPECVLWRPKEAFSDSVSNNSVNLKETLKNYATEKLKEINDIPDVVYQEPKPKTDEEIYYRYIYNKCYPNFIHHLPRYWLPPQEWFKETINDPSATILECYQDNKYKN